MAIYKHAKTGLDFVLVPGDVLDGLGGQPRAVTMTKPFLMCVTECTQGAWKKVSGGSNPSNWKGDTLPVEQVS